MPSTEKMRTSSRRRQGERSRGRWMRECGSGTHVDFRLPRTEADDENVVARTYDAIVDQLDEYGENEADVLAAATTGQRAIYALLTTDGEVNNGGFAQFFTNATGSLIGEAIAGAERVGLPTHVEILRQAANIFPSGNVPVDFDERNRPRGYNPLGVVSTSTSSASRLGTSTPLTGRSFSRSLRLRCC
jgi:Domain of unknown function (DUF4375)